MELAAQGEHVGPIERNIRYAKEKIRSLRYMLPFAQVPKNIIIYMVFNATIVMNMFPRKGGVGLLWQIRVHSRRFAR